MKNKLQKFLSLLLVLCAAVTSSAQNYDGVNGKFKNGGTWLISGQILYIDADIVPDYKVVSSIGFKSWDYRGQSSVTWSMGLERNMTGAPWGQYRAGIKEIVLTSKVKQIGSKAFWGMTSVKKVTVENSSQNLYVANEAFYNCYNMESFDFSRVNYIGERAFERCFNLQFANCLSLRHVEEGAFDWCLALWDKDGGVYLPETAPTGLNQMVTENLSGYYWVFPEENIQLVDAGAQFKILVDANRLQEYKNTFGNKAGEAYIYAGNSGWYLNNAGNLYLGKGFKEGIPNYTDGQQPWFSIKNKISAVYINNPSSNWSVGDNAFKGCNNLWDFPLNKITGSIGVSAFEGTDLCGPQTWVVQYLDHVTTIGDRAFAGSHLKKISLGSGLQTIGSKAFQNVQLNEVKIHGAAPTTANDAFNGVPTSSITLPVPDKYYNSYASSTAWSSFNINRIIDFPVYGTGWHLDEDGTLTIIQAMGFTQPSEQPWYSYKDYIEKVVFGNSDYVVTYIGQNCLAFENTGVSKIQSIEAPYVTTINAEAFKNNDILKSFKGENVMTIGNEAFAGCAALEDVDFGDKLTSLGTRVFNGCPAMENFALDAITPPTVTAQTFVGMGAQSAGAPGRNGVRKATGQKSVTLEVPESAVVTYANTLYWNLFSMDYIGEHGTIVAGDVFGNGMWVLYADSTLMVSCSSLETGSGIQDKTSMHNWGTYADKIKRIEVLGELPELYRSFNNLPNLESVSFSSSVKKLYSTFYNCPKLKEVPLSCVEEFREYGNVGCFEKCNALTEVKLQSARVIGYRCFAECASLKTVEFPNADTIANVAFVSCPKLESVTANNAYIGNAFRGCTGLKEVTLNGVKGHVIPSEAFKGCTALETVRINGSLHRVENDAFNGTALTDIYLSSPYPAEVANKNNSNVFYGLTLSNINLHVPADFVARYSASYNNPVWSRMNVVADTDYSEALIPTGGSLGSNGTWQLGTDQILVINCSDSMPTAQVAFGLDDYSSTWYDWMPYVTHIEFSKTTSSVAANAFGLYLADNNFAKVGTITLGEGMRKLDDRALFVKLSNGANVYCYAEEPPVLNGNNCFNWSEVTNANVTLHVLTKSGVLAKYQNAAGWQNFPNIVADLGPRYKVSWDAHNGYIKDESGIDLNSVPAGTTIHLTAVPYYGYWLKKWINYNPNTGLTVNSDVTVGAQFTTNHVVSFMKPSETFAGQWTVIKRDTVEEGTAATAPADPVREGYRFMGWDCSFDSIVKQTAVHAQFTPIVYAESVKVSPEIKSVQVSSSELGTKTFQCVASVSPGNVDNSAVTWSSDDASVATVDANGLATIHDFGSAYIIATAADGSNVSGKCLLGVFSTDFMPVIQGTAIAVENGITEITMTKSQSAKLVNLVVTPEDYNGGISVRHHGPLQVNPCGEGEKTLPAFFIKPEMGSTYPYDDTITFRMNDYDHQAVHSMPECKLIVHVTDDALFTAKTVEGVDMTFRITDPMTLTCEVYGYMEQLMMPDPVTGLPFVMHPAVDASTTGKITVPAVAKGCTVTNLSQQAFAGCSGLTEIELENGIQYIKMGAFQECSALRKLILPKSIKGLSMLGSMSQLANVYMYNPEPPIGWEIAENGENMMPDIAMTNAFQMIASNATLHVARGSLNAYNKAPWTTWFTTITDDVDASFTVRFVDWDDSEIELQHVDYCAAAAPSQTPVREGHTFTGWNKDFSRVVANMTVKAQYEAMTYSVTFLNWDGTQLGATQQVTYGQAAVAPSVPARSGYTFAGWSADFSKVTRDMTVKAMFAKEGQYLVTFIDWDETTLKCEIVDAGGDATAPEDPVREGYVFTGWSGSYTNVHADAIIRALYNEGTGIEEIFSQPDAPKALKVLIDGQIYILRNDGAIFDVRGVRVK